MPLIFNIAGGEKPCPTGKVRNPNTGRCIKVGGKVYNDVFAKKAEPRKHKANPTKKTTKTSTYPFLRKLTKVEKKLISWNINKTSITDEDIEAAVKDYLKGPFPGLVVCTGQNFNEKCDMYKDDIPNFLKYLTNDAKKFVKRKEQVPPEIMDMYNTYSDNKLTDAGILYLYGIFEHIYHNIIYAESGERNMKYIQTLLARFGMTRNKKVVTLGEKPMHASAYATAGGKEGDICRLGRHRTMKMLQMRRNGKYYWKTLDWRTLDSVVPQHKLHARCRYFM